MAVDAKFWCTQVESQGARIREDGTAGVTDKTVRLQAVMDTEGDNAEWSKYTPVGEIEMQITNPGAYDYFEPGQTYMVRFTKAQPNKARER